MYLLLIQNKHDKADMLSPYLSWSSTSTFSWRPDNGRGVLQLHFVGNMKTGLSGHM